MTAPASTTALPAERPGRGQRTRVSPLRGLEPTALSATRAAALRCQEWIGRGDGNAADAAATAAMRSSLIRAPGLGRVVVGEGAKDRAPMLYDGERVGSGHGPAFDIAVDPLECTGLCARGLPGSLATIAFAESGAMAPLGAAFYMDKLVGPAPLRGAIHLMDSVEDKLAGAAWVLDKPIAQLRVVVLHKPRHRELIERLHRAGACVLAPPDGDVAGALAAVLPDGGADLLMGIGGAPEGVMTACAVAALGGFMQARLAPQRPDEAHAVAKAGLRTDQIYELDELVHGPSLFAATGVTGGELLKRPWSSGGRTYTESILITEGGAKYKVGAA
jgi:fructose-1,6-bisphosphatase II